MSNLQDSIHFAHRVERQYVISAFESNSAFTKRASRLHDCCSHGKLFLEGYPPEVHLWIHRCGDRLCPICSLYRSRKVSTQLAQLMLTMNTPRHMVLTVRNHPVGNLHKAVQHLRSSFNRLRRTPEWKAHVKGGVYVIEISLSKDKKSWHPHLHILYQGDYFPIRFLSALWVDASQGSSVVWVNSAKGRHANYLAKYCGKPANLNKFPIDALLEYAQITQRMRMLQCFGDLHGKKIYDNDPRPEPSHLRSSITLKSLVDSAESGHVGAIRMCKLACLRWPRLWQYLRHGCDIPPPDLTNWSQKKSEDLDLEICRSARFVMELSVPLEKTPRKYRLQPGKQ